jgi:hypothetical protein
MLTYAGAAGACLACGMSYLDISVEEKAVVIIRRFRLD